jgi:MOSC domain-containing protein YiiM
LHLGTHAVVKITGLRNPCRQLDGLRPGLMAALLDRDADGNLVRKAGIMGIVLTGGLVTNGDAIVVELRRRTAPSARIRLNLAQRAGWGSRHAGTTPPGRKTFRTNQERAK